MANGDRKEKPKQSTGTNVIIGNTKKPDPPEDADVINNNGGGKGGGGDSSDPVIAAPAPAPDPQPEPTPILPATIARPEDPIPATIARPENEPSISDFYDSVTDPNVDQVNQSTNSDSNTLNQQNMLPDYVPNQLPQPPLIEPVEPVNTTVGNDNDSGGLGGSGDGGAAPADDSLPDADVPTEQEAYLASEGARGVDATKRRRRRAGYAGTVLTGPLGVSSESTGRTILG